MDSRIDTLQAVQDRQFDVCVIGGGATGLGTALDAQLRGKRTVLFDCGDFVSQTSSASTKLVHGGVRYLQQAVTGLDYGQFQMVRKGLQERIHMLEAAPYLAHPIELLVPCFSRWEMFYFAIGMKMYDLIAGKAHLFPSRILSRKQAAKALPALRMDGVAGAVTYADGQFDDARYGMAMAQTFSQQGGELLNYAKVAGFARGSDRKLAGAMIEDRLSGQQFTLRARVFLNCTGPFADEVRLMANPAMPRRLRVSKGIHILLPADVMQSETALLIPQTEDGRIIFAIAWLGSLLVGTTEDEVEHGAEMVATRDEVAYLLKYVNKYLNTAFTFADVQAAFAGARPLVASTGSIDTKKLIRDHEVEIDKESGLISILGGKWTTYRAMAEDGVDCAIRALGDGRTRTKTLGFQLTGSREYSGGFWKELSVKYRLSSETAKHLAQKFGTDAARVLEVINSAPGLDEPLYPGAAALTGEVLYCIREEMAQSIEDVLARRIGIQFHSWKDATAAAPAVGRLLGRELGWSEEATMRAIESYIDAIARLARLAAVSPDFQASSAAKPNYQREGE
jgi:glycerol-3-phosphate dehydrogenase